MTNEMKIKLKSGLLISEIIKSLTLAVIAAAAVFGTAIVANAQKFADVQTQKSPLVLQAQGSFYVGGERVEQTREELGSFGPAGHITVNQMYVRYMIPPNSDRNPSIVMIHGMTLTGKTWETTPDGRMGWDEYFVRKGYSVYVPDQVGRGRSGFNQAVFNNVRAGGDPLRRLFPIWRISDENTWTNFRFGTKPGTPYPDAQFPVAAIDELSKQAVPDLSLSLPAPNPTYKSLSALAGEVKNAVLMSHSQSGAFPLEAALVNPSEIKGVVLVEPGVCPATYTNQQISTLAKIPILIIFGDHLGEIPTGIPGFSWQTAFDGCRAFITRVNGAGGNAEMLFAPDKGIRGNSHMIMQDKNNLQIADLILKWIEENVSQSKVPVNNQIENKNMKEIEDKLALKELVDTFSVLADKKETNKQTLLFTEDATVESYSNGQQNSSLKGRKQIGEAFANFLKNFETVYHINGQQTVIVSGDKASGTSYCLVVLIGEENGRKIKTTMGVIYEDEYVRQNGNWLIAKRKSNFTWRERQELGQ